MPRNPILRQFQADCRTWYGLGNRRRHCTEARLDVYRQLIDRHGVDAAVRHAVAIARLLSTVEAQVIEEVCV